MKKIILSAIIIAAISSCSKSTHGEPDPKPVQTNDCPDASCINPDTVFNQSATGPLLKFVFKFDSTQTRLDNLGNPSTIPSNNAGFSPRFNKMSAHYIEMAQNDVTAVGSGAVLYKAAETKCADGTNSAIAFCKSVVVREGSVFFSIPLSQVPAGTYKWLRVSLAYQNYDIPFLTSSTGNATQWGTIASFLGFNTYVKQYKIKNMSAVPTASTGGPGNHKQGYWGFETNVSSQQLFFDGQSAGVTTVVNPNPSSPIPAGSCLVTGQFNKASANTPIVITGTETADIIVTVSLSTNKSFEWREVAPYDGYYKPEAGEFPVDMGVRGMIAKY